jgi:hypothetical protein
MKIEIEVDQVVRILYTIPTVITVKVNINPSVTINI